MSKNKTRTKDKYRVVYNDTQRIELENEFRLNEYIAIPRKQEIAQKLQLSERQIKIWFQNRRAKKRKQMKRRPGGNSTSVSKPASSMTNTTSTTLMSSQQQQAMTSLQPTLNNTTSVATICRDKNVSPSATIIKSESILSPSATSTAPATTGHHHQQQQHQQHLHDSIYHDPLAADQHQHNQAGLYHQHQQQLEEAALGRGFVPNNSSGSNNNSYYSDSNYQECQQPDYYSIINHPHSFQHHHHSHNALQQQPQQQPLQSEPPLPQSLHSPAAMTGSTIAPTVAAASQCWTSSAQSTSPQIPSHASASQFHTGDQQNLVATEAEASVSPYANHANAAYTNGYQQHHLSHHHHPHHHHNQHQQQQPHQPHQHHHQQHYAVHHQTQHIHHHTIMQSQLTEGIHRGSNLIGKHALY